MLPNRMGIITGPAATGKTEFIMTIVQPFLYRLASFKLNTFEGFDYPQVLICTPDDAAASQLASHIYNSAQENLDSQNAVVIRMHSVATETSAIEYENENSISRGVCDRRYDLHEMSLATKCSGSRASLIKESFHRMENPKQHSALIGHE